MSEGKVGKMPAKESSHHAAPVAKTEPSKLAGDKLLKSREHSKLKKPDGVSGKHKGRGPVVAKVTIKPAKGEVPEGLPKQFLSKSTFNTHDIMHSPVEKTLLMLDKILSGERLFTM